MESADILILGGGPAGLSTALHMVQSAPSFSSRILLLEKDYYPRPKLCAGGLVRDAEVLLEKLGLDVSKVPHVESRTVHLDFIGKGLTISNPKKHTLRIIRRDEFDHWLAVKARERGIMIREGVLVQDIRQVDDGVIVSTDKGDFHAKTVVCADGSNSVTRRSVFPNAPVHKARALEVIATSAILVERPEEGNFSLTRSLESQNINSHPDKHAFFDFIPVSLGIGGYIWDFPTQVEGIPMRCWGIYDANLFTGHKRPLIKDMLSDEMKRHGFDLGSLKLEGCPIRRFDPFNVFSTSRLLLVGDAAGVGPLFGEGISIALGYGKVAAETILDAFRRDKFDFTEYKRRVLMSPLGQTLLMRWITACLIYGLKWRWLHILIWRILKPLTILISWLFVLNWGRRM